jgi:hypothetical protein
MHVNNRRKAEGLETKPVICSVRFLQALLAIEESFEDRKIFHKRSDGQIRLMHHVTRADLQLFMTLQVGFNLEGKSEFVNRHMIYQQLVGLYEDPICVDQFYQSFAKFVHVGLIHAEEEPISGDYIYTLVNYLEPDTQKIGRFVLLHPLVFTAAFTSLPIAAQRLYLFACGMQGDAKYKLLQKNWEGLAPLLHTHAPYQIKNLLELMTTRPIWDNLPLFSNGRLERNAIGGNKIVYQVHPKLIPAYEPKTMYHDVLQAKGGYRTLVRWLRSVLDAHGLSELETFRNGFCFKQLVHLLKKKSKAFAGFVINHLKALYQEHRYFPDDLAQYIQKEIHESITAKILSEVTKSGMYDFLIPKPTIAQERISQFVKFAGGLKPSNLRQVLRSASGDLWRTYGQPPIIGPVDYMKLLPINEKIHMGRLRDLAYELQVDQQAFFDIQEEADRRLFRGESIWNIESWFQKRLEDLPKWQPVPQPPEAFCLEDYLTSYLPH